MTITQFLQKRITINLGKDRSKKVVSNIIRSFAVKIISTVITLLLIPVSLAFVDKATYGVWLTIASVIAWLNIFDFGLAMGLTNRISEAAAANNTRLIKTYLSTTYVILLICLGTISIIFFAVFNYINWSEIFNTSIQKATLERGLKITYLSFCFLFVMKPISSLLMAYQKHFLSSSIQAVANGFSLVLIYFFGSFSSNPFLFLIIAFSLSTPVFLLIYSVVLYWREYRIVAPSFKYVNFKHTRSLFGISSKFFIVQICVLVLLTSNNFLIAHFVDNESVTYYNIAYRLFSTVSIFQLMFIHPLWTAFNNAYTLKDFTWIKKVMNKVNKMNLILVFISISIFLFHKTIYHLWFGPTVVVPVDINFLILIYSVLILYNQTYIYFINGIGKLNLQSLFSIVSIILHFPLAYLLMKKMALGLPGLLALNIFWTVVGCVLWKRQYEVIISQRPAGAVWN